MRPAKAHVRAISLNMGDGKMTCYACDYHRRSEPASVTPRYAIVVTSHYYGPEDRKGLLTREDGQRALTFSSASAARQYVRERLETGRYYTEHNEICRPDYAVRRVDRLPEYLAREV